MEAATVTAAPPERDLAGRRSHSTPELAEGVELLGEMPGSGYRRAPALARRRDGQTVKLTPLLHHLIQGIDGTRDYEELANDLSRRIGKRATATDVGYLIERKLRPLGLLRGADGAQPVPRKANPLLALRLRAILSRPELTNRLAAPFVWLFNPVVAVPVLAGFAVLCWWLLAEKGVTSALHAAFYDPMMILAVWGMIIVSAAFHEIGHAAAARYGGARPGVMGAGLYLVWPVFYTDVSDSYRLDRRGRLRVDLGGLYFSAIFALGTAAFWAITRHDAVLLVIAIQLVQMVRQLAPFVRADGYHLMADLTGVPDLFAHIKPTLLGLLPGRWGRGGRSDLKPWARGVVSAWVLIVVPILVALLAYIVFILPRLAATAWDSMGLEWAAATASWGNADPAALVVSLLSAGIVALPVLGIIYLLWRIARRAATRMWAATSDRPPLRAAAVAGAAALAGLVAWAWWPGEQYQPIRANEQGLLPSITLSVPGGLASEAAPAVGESPVPELPGSPPEADASRPPSGGGQPVGGSVEPGEQAELSAEAPAAWPFPFEPPEPPGPGDNQALAVNTQDDSTLLDLATSLLVVQGGSVDQANEAYALASCTRCTTVAVAFQLILVVGYVEEITPSNTAVAVNYECQSCTTAAFAYQIVTTLLQMPTDEMLQELTSLLQRLQALEAQAGSLSLEEIYLALEQIELDLLETLAEAGGSSPDLSAPSGERPASTVGSTPQASQLESPSATGEAPAPVADPGSGTCSPNTDPTASGGSDDGCSTAPPTETEETPPPEETTADSPAPAP